MTSSKVLATVRFRDVTGSPEFTVEVKSMTAFAEALDKAREAIKASTFGVVWGTGHSEVVKMEKVVS
jgi:hypothetical protein